MRKDEISLVARGVRFRSKWDEDAFFEWLRRFDCVESAEGAGLELRITVARSKVTDLALRELLALFFRYEIEMSQLATFRTQKNRRWFSSPQAYWHKMVFPQRGG